eukprot:363737-Chlamydomonas_euryale.AAC.12
MDGQRSGRRTPSGGVSAAGAADVFPSPQARHGKSRASVASRTGLAAPRRAAAALRQERLVSVGGSFVRTSQNEPTRCLVYPAIATLSRMGGRGVFFSSFVDERQTTLPFKMLSGTAWCEWNVQRVSWAVGCLRKAARRWREAELAAKETACAQSTSGAYIAELQGTSRAMQQPPICT